MISVYQIKSEEPKTPFAPVYNYYICTADISTLIDFNNIPTELVTEFRKKVLKIQTTEDQ